MSTNGWKPRTIETLECPSGQVVRVKRPGPEFTLRAGRVTRTFTRTEDKPKKKQKKQTQQEKALDDLAHMSDEELAAIVIFARELVCTMLVSPKLVLNPDPDKDEVGPDDIGDDFWFLFNYGMANFYGMKVPAGNGEVEVADLASFRGESGIQGDGVDGLHVPSADQHVA